MAFCYTTMQTVFFFYKVTYNRQCAVCFSWSGRLRWWVGRSRIPEHTEAAAESDSRARVQDHGASQGTHVFIAYFHTTQLSLGRLAFLIFWSFLVKTVLFLSALEGHENCRFSLLADPGGVAPAMSSVCMEERKKTLFVDLILNGTWTTERFLKITVRLSRRYFSLRKYSCV